MDEQLFCKLTRNILATLLHLDPFKIFPADDQSEERRRFGQDPFGAFLKSSDAVQAQIVREAIEQLQPLFRELETSDERYFGNGARPWQGSEN